jgi:hypothetical protein
MIRRKVLGEDSAEMRGSLLGSQVRFLTIVLQTVPIFESSVSTLNGSILTIRSVTRYYFRHVFTVLDFSIPHVRTCYLKEQSHSSRKRTLFHETCFTVHQQAIKQVMSSLSSRLCHVAQGQTMVVKSAQNHFIPDLQITLGPVTVRYHCICFRNGT